MMSQDKNENLDCFVSEFRRDQQLTGELYLRTAPDLNWLKKIKKTAAWRFDGWLVQILTLIWHPRLSQHVFFCHTPGENNIKLHSLPIRRATGVMTLLPIEFSSPGAARRVQNFDNEVMKTFSPVQLIQSWGGANTHNRYTSRQRQRVSTSHLLRPSWETLRLWQPKTAQSTTAALTQVSTRSFLYFRSDRGQRTRRDSDDGASGMTAVILYTRQGRPP